MNSIVRPLLLVCALGFLYVAYSAATSLVRVNRGLPAMPCSEVGVTCPSQSGSAAP